jgi:hypothetical protein
MAIIPYRGVIRGLGLIPKREKDKEYWAEYMKRRGFVTPRIDASKTSIRDLRAFCNALFPFNPRKAELAEAIFREMSRLRASKVELYRDLAPKIIKEKRCSARTLSQTWKALLRSGLLHRARRNEPARLSDIFSNRLEMMANYWREVMKAIEEGEL